MPRILVLYGTSDGQTAKVARVIGARLLVDGIDTDIIQAGTADPSPADYDGIIIAASVRAGGYQKAVRKWVRRHVAEFGARPDAFVSVCLSVASTHAKEREEAAAIPRRFFDSVGWHPAVVTIVAGALLYTKYNIVIRWIMKRIAQQAGGDTDVSRDYEYTDWRALREFAGAFGRHVMATAPVTTGIAAA